MRVHFCIVSEQPIPNLSAALDGRLRADRLVLLTSQEMATRAERLALVASRYGIETVKVYLRERLDLTQVAHDVERALDNAADADEILLNTTGGQKPMAIAAYEVFLRRGHHAFYVDTDNTVVWLPPAKSERLVLDTRLGITDYLDAYGAKVIRLRQDVDPRGALTEELVCRVSTFGPALSVLNGLAASARGGQSTVLTEKQRRSRLLSVA